MIAKLAENIAVFFAQKKVYKHESIPVYKYGFELLLSTIINFAIILFIAFLFGIAIESILFILGFISLRLTAGGYHAKHHWSCILVFCSIFFIFTIIRINLNPSLLFKYSLCISVLSLIIIFVFSPVEATNKPMPKEIKDKHRRTSIGIVCTDMIVLLVTIFLPTPTLLSLFFYFLSGAFAASIFLIVGKIHF